MKILLRSGYTFSSQNRRIDFSGVPVFDIRGLLLVINKTAGERVIYAAGDEAVPITGVIGTAVTFAYDTTPMSDTDVLEVFYDDGVTTSGPVDTLDNGDTIAAGSVAVAMPADPRRQLLILSNTGPNPLAYRFGSDPTATLGHGLAPGGTIPFIGRCAVEELRVFSTDGTTFFATAG